MRPSDGQPKKRRLSVNRPRQKPKPKGSLKKRLSWKDSVSKPKKLRESLRRRPMQRPPPQLLLRPSAEAERLRQEEIKKEQELEAARLEAERLAAEEAEKERLRIEAEEEAERKRLEEEEAER